jgi:hypothetical protein
MYIGSEYNIINLWWISEKIPKTWISLRKRSWNNDFTKTKKNFVVTDFVGINNRILDTQFWCIFLFNLWIFSCISGINIGFTGGIWSGQISSSCHPGLWWQEKCHRKGQLVLHIEGTRAEIWSNVDGQEIDASRFYTWISENLAWAAETVGW